MTTLDPRGPSWETIRACDLTDRSLLFAVGACMVYAEALIEIAAAFEYYGSPPRAWCAHCLCSMRTECSKYCVGLLARKVLGVA